MRSEKTADDLPPLSSLAFWNQPRDNLNILPAFGTGDRSASVTDPFRFRRQTPWCQWGNFIFYDTPYSHTTLSPTKKLSATARIKHNVRTVHCEDWLRV